MSNPLLSVQHHPAMKQFQFHSRGATAVLDYRMRGDRIIFTHTGVPELLSGRGVGSALAKAGLSYAHEHHLQVRPLCPFVKDYIDRHEEYQPLVVKQS